MRLGILTSHPIQYQAPWFRALASKVDLRVFFAHRQTAVQQGQAGFGVPFEWDVDLLRGFTHTFLRNIAEHPDVNRFGGCDTPEIATIIGSTSASRSTTAERRERSFDAFIICGWYLKSYLQAARACRVAGVPVLVRGDSQLRTPRPMIRRWLKGIPQRWLLRQFDGFLSVGQRHREYLQHYGVPSHKIFSVPHCVDNQWFAARAEEARPQRTAIRREWGVFENDVATLFVGKFIAKKRPLDLLRALTKLGETGNRRVIAVFVGGGELENDLRDVAAREKLPVHFAGFKNQSELPACYVAADVLVLPSNSSETWGLVVNEAMACGLPAIVSDRVGCGPDLIEEGKTGFVFPMGDELALSDRLEKFAGRLVAGHYFAPALAAKMRTYGVDKAADNTLQAVAALKRCNG